MKQFYYFLLFWSFKTMKGKERSFYTEFNLELLYKHRLG